MHELIRLLTEFGADEATIALAQRWVDREVEGTTPLTDDEITTLRTALVALAEDDDAGFPLLEEAANVVDQLSDEATARDEAAADEEQRIAEQRARLRGETAEDETPEGDDDAPPAEGDEPPAEDEPGDDAPAETDADLEPVTAGASQRAARRTLRRRTPADARPAPEHGNGVRILMGGQQVDDLATVDRALMSRAESFQTSSSGVPGRELVRVATLHADYPEERRLGTDSARNTQLVTAALREHVMSLRSDPQVRARVASGGLCGPLTPYWGVDVLGSTSRPVRDTALVGFQAGAARGGMVSMAPPILPALAGSTVVWTEANDADPGSDGPATKPCLRIECGEDRTTRIYAVPSCLEIGNFMARTYGEWVDAWSELSMVNAARVAEVELLAAIETFSTKPDAITTQWSATIDLLTTIDQAVAGFRSRHRLDETFPIRVILPDLVRTVIRTDLARALRSGSFAENFAVADASITGFFTARNVNVTWSLDMSVMGQQASDTPLATLPDAVDMALYPEGTFLHLDGGELNLGMVRDSVLIATNDAQTFVEFFEAVHPIGVESLWLTINLCPSGAMSGTIDPAAFCSSYT